MLFTIVLYYMLYCTINIYNTTTKIMLINISDVDPMIYQYYTSYHYDHMGGLIQYHYYYSTDHWSLIEIVSYAQSATTIHNITITMHNYYDCNIIYPASSMLWTMSNILRLVLKLHIYSSQPYRNKNLGGAKRILKYNVCATLLWILMRIAATRC